MKHNVITLFGVVAILIGIVYVRSAFDQTIATEEEKKAAEAAKADLAEAAEITEGAEEGSSDDDHAGHDHGEQVDADNEHADHEHAEGGDTQMAKADSPSDSPAVTTAPVPADISGFESIDWAETAPEVFQVKFDTTAGPFVVESYQKWAPLGHERFYELCKVGFFNDTGFFRVVPGFVVQFGLAADPKMTAQYKSKPLRDEPVRKSNQRGKVTFATSGANTRTTQLFINFGDNANLDGMGFTPFGEVIQGMDVVDKITSEYGEAPQQGNITMEGTSYLKKNFPKLDFIKQVTLVKVAAPAAEAAPAPAAEPAPAPAAEAAPVPAQG